MYVNAWEIILLINYGDAFEFLDDWLIHIYEKKRWFKYHGWAGLNAQLMRQNKDTIEIAQAKGCWTKRFHLEAHKLMGTGAK